VKPDQEIDSHNEDDSHCENSNENLKNIDVKVWSSMGVPNVVIRALADQNFRSPTEIQTRTLLPAILGYKDIMGAAETGSGKTLAFGIPIIKGILDLKELEAAKASERSAKYDSQSEARNSNSSGMQSNTIPFY
jgi:ATP-dependent RNA helicase DDX24/MAK5